MPIPYKDKYCIAAYCISLPSRTSCIRNISCSTPISVTATHSWRNGEFTSPWIRWTAKTLTFLSLLCCAQN